MDNQTNPSTEDTALEVRQPWHKPEVQRLNVKLDTGQTSGTDLIDTKISDGQQ